MKKREQDNEENRRGRTDNGLEVRVMWIEMKMMIRMARTDDECCWQVEDGK